MSGTLPVAHEALEALLLRLAAVLAILILVSLGFGALFRRLGQPKEIGEIVAGILLGPSLLGGIFPDAYRALLTSEVSRHLSVLSQIGLVLLMMLIGAEFPFHRIRDTIRGAFAVAAAGIAVPFALTLLVAPLFVRGLGIEPGRATIFSLLLATAVSITAMPVLGRILRLLGLTRTPVGLLSITAAAIDDVLGWMLLGAVISLMQAGLDPAGLLRKIALASLLAVAVFMVGKLALSRVPASRYAAGLPAADFAALLAFALLLAVCTNAIGVFSILGGFLAGVAISFQPEMARALDQRLHDFVSVFFLPVFFMLTGLRTNIHGIGLDASAWGLLLLLLVVAAAGKLVPCALAARLTGMPWRESLSVGFLMNTRGLMALVVINIGYDLGAFPERVFFMLVTMALVMTVVTTPVLRRLIPV